MLPTFLYFDLGKVLLDFDHPRMCRQMAEVLKIDAQRLEQLILPTNGTPFDPLWQLECGMTSEAEFFEWVCKELDATPQFETLSHAACDIFTPIEASFDLVRRLSKAGYRMGILSNTNIAHWRFVNDGRYPVLNECFEIGLTSFQLKAMKPAASIYQDAAKKVGLPTEALFFVDDKQENVDGAITCGIDAVLFTTTEQLEADLRSRGLEF